MRNIGKLAVSGGTALLLATSLAAPAHSASSSGATRYCTPTTVVGLTTYTDSVLNHFHTYVAPSGAYQNRSGTGTTIARSSTFQQARWSANNGSSEPWRSAPAPNCFPRPV